MSYLTVGINGKQFICTDIFYNYYVRLDKLTLSGPAVSVPCRDHYAQCPRQVT